MKNHSIVWGDYCIINEAGNRFVVYVDDNNEVTAIRWYVSPSYSSPLAPEQWDKVVLKFEPVIDVIAFMNVVCKTHTGFNSAINARQIASFTVSEKYKQKILIRAMLHHAKALFTATTENGNITYQITGYDKRK